MTYQLDQLTIRSRTTRVKPRRHAAPDQTRKSGRTFIPEHCFKLGDAFAFIEHVLKCVELAGHFGRHVKAGSAPSHFVTLTMRDQFVAGVGRVPLGMISMNKVWKQFCQLVRATVGHRFEFICVVENQRRGVPHVHALLYGSDELAGHERFIEECCWEDFGRARVQAFERGRNAAEYLGKYIGKESRKLSVFVSRDLLKRTSAHKLSPAHVSSEAHRDVLDKSAAGECGTVVSTPTS